MKIAYTLIQKYINKNHKIITFDMKLRFIHPLIFINIRALLIK